MRHEGGSGQRGDRGNEQHSTMMLFGLLQELGLHPVGREPLKALKQGQVCLNLHFRQTPQTTAWRVDLRTTKPQGDQFREF